MRYPVWLSVVTMVVTVAGLAACRAAPHRPTASGSSTGTPGAGTCDDTVRATAELPAALREAGIGAAVGDQDVWFIAPADGTWSSSVVRTADGFTTKRPLWTTSTKLPVVSVRELRTGALGSVELTPTSAGLPGPIPALLRFPSAGCWLVTAKAEHGEVRIRVRV